MSSQSDSEAILPVVLLVHSTGRVRGVLLATKTIRTTRTQPRGKIWQHKKFCTYFATGRAFTPFAGEPEKGLNHDLIFFHPWVKKICRGENSAETSTVWH